MATSTEMVNTPTVGVKRAGNGISPWDLWVLLVPLAAMLPMLLIQWQHLMSRAERQFFPLLVIIAFYFPLRAVFLANGDATEARLPLGRARTAVGTLACGVAMYALSVWLFSPWLAHVAAITVFFAWALGRCVAVPWTTVLAWTGLLAVTVPLPFNFDQEFIGWLQSSSSWACSSALDALGVPHFRRANVIEVRGRQLFVEEACSGIGSMYALLAAGSLLVLINGRSLVVALATLVSVPVWAMLGNFIRLLAIALAQHFYERDLSHGMDHELLGVLTFSIAALGLWMTEWMAATLLQPVPPTAPEFGFAFQTANAVLCWPGKDPFAHVEPEEETPAERKAREAAEAALLARQEAAVIRVRPFEIKPLRILARTASSFALVLGIAPAIIVTRGTPTEIFSFGLPRFSDAELQELPGAESMPEELGQWKRVGFSKENRSSASLFGEHSLIWEYRRGDNRLAASMDFPFRGPHPLDVCYTNSGWTVDGAETLGGREPNSWAWTRLELSNDFGSRAVVFYATFTEDGEPYSPGYEGMLERQVSSRIAAALLSMDSAFQPVCYQVQVMCESGRKFTDEEEADIQATFLQARAALLEKIRILRSAR